MSIPESLMLVCFGISWPVSVYKTYKTKNAEGKSVFFLSLVLLGYVFGIIHKIFYSMDFVIFLYIFNGIMVVIDLILYFMYNKSNSHCQYKN